jgi:hypothetical protein
LVKDDRRRARPKPKAPKRTSGEWEYFLGTKEAIEALGAAVVHHKRRELAKRKKVLARRVPSSTWLSAAWDEGLQFPPAWDHPRTDELTEPPATAMKCCRGCHRETPPQCVGSSGHCEDCRLGQMSPMALSKLGASSSAINIAKARMAARLGRQYSGGY